MARTNKGTGEKNPSFTIFFLSSFSYAHWIEGNV
jgi:hypothetical protein